MMMNLFSIFDPCSSFMGLSLNWMSLGLGFLILPLVYWYIPSRVSMVWIKLYNILFNELRVITGSSKCLILMLVVGLFMFLLFNNFLGLFPYIFTGTSHMVMSVSMALPLWMSFMLYGWVNQLWMMLAHLVPQGTPNVLVPFMVLVEFISLMIRPLTLSVRLAANMVAGHLLVSLLGNLGPYMSMSMLGGFISVNILLLILENAVSVIQAYVFVVLITLYYFEVK